MKRKATSTKSALTLAAALAFGHGFLTPAMAKEDAEVLSIEQVIEKVKEQGFTDIRQIERTWRSYEVKAHDSHGDLVEIYIDSVTGDVLTWDYEY